ncbi:MAG: tetR-type protein [Bacteroidota bacterium]|nr:tetR-type protein [Bacteroidota bacterium]MDQ1332948.1 tetR-type protein [Bacteroidota bacterium]
MAVTDRQTEEKIFEAATDVFTEKGMDGARMQDIANHAGINKALLHYYYRTKDHLFNAVFEKIAGQMFKKFAPVLDENLSLEEKIRFFFREHIAFMQKNPRLPSFILNELHRNPERIRKLIQGIDINKLWTTLEVQHKEELNRYNITKENIPQFMTTIAGMSVFPFVAKPVIASLMGKMGYDFDTYIEERKEYAADFIIHAMKKQKIRSKKKKV